MATQTTGGGSTTSFTNTPQAKDDTYNYLEDLLRNDATIYNVATNTVTLDVMSNDLGGNAKALFSVEDGDGNALTADFDLLAKDVNAAGVSPWEETLNHNWVRINNGKIEYRIADGSGIPGQGRSVDSLTAGENFNDQFVYAIRLGNGTLSEATVKIHITGANDAATIGVVGASDDSVTEAGGAANAIPGDPSAGGTLVVNDADLGDNKFQAPSASSLNGTYGTFTFNPTTGVWAYTLDNNRSATQALAAGAAVTETLTVTSFDGTATYNIVVNVHGTNDNPVAVADTGSGTENQVLTIDVLANDTDVDTGHSFTVTNVSVPAGQGSVSIVGNQLRFDPGSDFDHLAQGATVTVTVNYTMQDEHGASSSSTATITVTGTNDGPTANADVNGLDVVSESGVHPGNSAFPGDPSASGNLLANDTDPDDGAVLTIKDVNGAAGNVGTPIEGTYGSITINANGTWSYALNNADSDTQALAQDAHVTESFSYTVKDEWGATSTATLTISITGTNDAPDLSASVTSGSYTDTAADDTFGNISGTLSTVDPDTGDTAAYSVAGGVADGSLLGYDMSKASAYGTLYLNSATGAYRFVPNDAAIEGLKSDDSVGFTLTVTDGHGATDSETLTINIDGANDTPELSASLTAHTYVDTSGDDSFAAVNGTLSSTDRDSGDSATYSVAGGVPDVSLAGYDHSASSAYGTLYLNSSSGAYTFVPNDGAIEGLKTDDSAVFTLTVTDGSGASDSETLTITLDGANDTPELGAVTDASYNDTAADDSFANVTGTLTSSDRDTGDSATYSVGGQVSDNSLAGYDRSASSAYGTLYLNSSSGAYTFVPNDAAIEGLKTTDHVDFVVMVTDSDGASDSDTLTITLNGVNDTPDAAATNGVTTDEDTASSAVAIGASDRDAGEVLTYSVKTGEAPAHGSVSFDQGAGTFVYTPAADYNGSDSFTVLVTDASGGTTEQVVSVTVNAVADIVDDSDTTNEDNSVTTTVLGNDNFEGTPVVTSVTQGTHGSVAINADNTVTYTPNADYNGSDSYTYTVTSGGVTETATVNVTIDPVADIADDSDSTNEDNAVTTTVLGNDSFEGTPVVTSVTQGAHGSVAINADNTVTYTPNADYNGSDSYTYTVTSGGVTETATVNVTINAVADIADDSDSTNEDTAVITNVLANDSFEDAAAAVTGVTQGAHGTVVNNNDGTVTYTPNADYNGSDSYTYTVTSGGVTETATVNVTINAVADIADDSDSTNEDTAVITNVLANDSFEDAAAAVTGVTQGAHGTVVNNNDGTVTYTPNADYNGSDSYTYTVTSGGVTETATVNVTINAVADIADDSDSTNEDTAVITNVLANDSFEDAAAAVTGVTQGAHGTVVNNNDGTVTYTPNADYNGSDSYTYTVTSGGVTETATVNVTINAVADIADDSDSTNEDTAVITNVLANDSFEDAAAAVTGVTQGAHGTVVNNNDGTVTYTPNADYNGSDSYTYTVTSGGVTETATVNVTIDPVADIADDSDTTNEDTAVITNVLANDSFEDAGAAVTSVTQGAHGSVAINGDNTVTYTPNADYNGSDSYTYTVTSGGVTETATVNVTIDPVADIADDSDTTNEDTAVITNVLANDSFEGTPVVTSVTQGTHGSVAINGDNTVTYTPNADYNGSDSYTYTVTSGGVTETATVNVTIDPVADIADDSDTTNEDTAVITNVLANDSFEDAAAAVTGVTQGTHGSVVNNGDGTVTYTPNADYNGSDSYTYTVTSGGVTETATVNVTVNPVNDAPAGADNSKTIAEDSNYVFATADFGFSDGADGDGFAGVKITTLPTDGTLLLSGVAVTVGQFVSFVDLAVGNLTFMPDANENGTAYASFTFQVQDTGGTANGGVDLDQSPNTFTFNVTAVNDAPVITSDGGGATANVNVAENSTAVTTVTSTDVDGPAATYSIVGGADSALFTINSSTGALSFISAPNFESPADAGANNVYDVIVQASDGSLVDTQAIAVTVTNVNEAPTITSNGGGDNAAVNVAENSTAVTTVVASDVDAGTTLTYSIVGGADQTLFTINASTGALSFVSAPNFESPADSGANNVYDVIVQASDGSLVDSQAIAVTVTDVNAAPVITSNGGGASANINVAENSSAVTTVVATDDGENAGTITYSISGGADSAKFTINSSTGALSFVSAPNFESPTDAGANNVYDVIVQASDGTLVDTQAIAVTVTNVNEAPTITSNGGGDNAAVSVAENSTAVTTVVATDVDAGTTITYSIVGGADSAKFSINSSTGALSFVSAPNFESPTDSGANNVYDVIVRASDGSLTDDQAIAVTVTNVNTAPVITSNGGGASANINVAENSTAVTTVTATDDGENSNTLTYSIVGGADQTLFTINASTGALSFVSAPNFESPADAGANNIYDVVVRASDGSLTDDQAIAVTVTNVNEAPTITSNGGGATANVNVAENSTAVTTVIATDPDAGTTLTYSISGGADSALFTINASTGALSFVSAPNFESPTDSGANNVYDVIVRASDGTLTDDQSIAVTVTDVGESGVITNIALGTGIVIPEWALLYTNGSAATDVTGASGAVGGTVTHVPGVGTNGSVNFTDAAPAGGSFNFTTTNAETFNVGVSQDTVGNIDGTANNDIIIGTNGGSTIQGNAGNDVLLGGTGNDTYVFGLNDGSDIVGDGGGGGGQDKIQILTSLPTDSTSISNLNFERVGNDMIIDVGGTHITLRGQYSGTAIEQFSFSNGGSIFGYALSTTTYGLGLDSVSPLDGTSQEDIIASSSGAETLNGANRNDLLFGNGGNDTINGGDGNDLIMGGAGNDILNGENGNDTIVGGAGTDTIAGGAGTDTFVLTDASTFDTITDYAAGEVIDITTLLTTAGSLSGFVRLTTTGDLQLDANGGGDSYVTIAHINTLAVNATVTYSTGPGTTATVTVVRGAPPIGVDMDGDGQVSFLAANAGATFDYGYGKVATAWVAGNDGILVRDANHDGQASANEIVFATSGSDLQGLAVYDSNHDGQLSSADAAFADFQVWQDANSNGVVDKGEMQSLTALGIASISLSSDGIGYSAAGGDVSVVGTGSYTRSDGSTGVLADVVFNTGAAAQQDQSRLTASNSNAALIGAIAAAGLAASEPLAAASVQGESHASAQVFGTPVHDGIELSPVAATAVATLQAAEQMASYNDHQGSPGETAPAALASDGNAELDSSASQAASAPADLLQATDAPAHEAIVSATPFAAPSIAMPSAEQLTAGATAEPAQHNQVVGQVLADALHGGAAQGPDIDGLLASLPHAPGLAESLAVHAGAAGFDGGAAFMVGPIALSMEMFVAHMDAPAHG